MDENCDGLIYLLGLADARNRSGIAFSGSLSVRWPYATIHLVR